MVFKKKKKKNYNPGASYVDHVNLVNESESELFKKLNNWPAEEKEMVMVLCWYLQVFT